MSPLVTAKLANALQPSRHPRGLLTIQEFYAHDKKE